MTRSGHRPGRISLASEPPIPAASISQPSPSWPRSSVLEKSFEAIRVVYLNYIGNSQVPQEYIHDVHDFGSAHFRHGAAGNGPARPVAGLTPRARSQRGRN